MTDLEQRKLIISSPTGATDVADEALEDADNGADFELRQLRVPITSHGARLDLALAQIVPEFSRSYLQQLIVAGSVQLNGLPLTKSSTRVKAGDELRIDELPDRLGVERAIPLAVVFPV